MLSRQEMRCRLSSVENGSWAHCFRACWRCERFSPAVAVAKKLAVLLALRVYGLKKLYRGGMRLNNRFVTDPWAHRKVRGVMHSVAAGAMKMGDTFERPARRYMNKIMGYEEKPTKMS